MIGITRPVVRLSPARLFSKGQSRPIVIELRPDRPGLIGFRLKGTRKTLYLPVDHCYREALRAEIARIRTEKRKAREERRKA